MKTDGNGGFLFPLSGAEKSCEISVTHPGFARYRSTADLSGESLRIRLSLAAQAEVFNVTAEPADNDPLERRTLTSLSLSADELRKMPKNTIDLIRYAEILAGANGTQESIRVDGLSNVQLPPAELIARITINGDPFSAEYTDGDRTIVDITTKTADRHFRFSIDGGSLGGTGHDTLRPGLRSSSKSNGFSFGAPIARLPLTFSVHLSNGNNSSDVPIQAVRSTSGASAPFASEKAVASSRFSSASLDLYYSIYEKLNSHFSYYQSRSGSLNVNVGGLTLPDAGLSTNSISRGGSATFSNTQGFLTFRGAFVFSTGDSTTKANSSDAGLNVMGSFVAGGAAATDVDSKETRWTWRSVIQSDGPKGEWTSGFTLSGNADVHQQTPNAAGSFTFESLQAYSDAIAGAPTGTWLVTRGDGANQYRSISAAPFVQKTLIHSTKLLVDAGVRADYQSALGMMVSPRVSAVTVWKKIIFRTGEGIFTSAVPNAIFERAIAGDGQHLQQYIATNVAFSDTGGLNPDAVPTIGTRLGRHFTAPQEFMAKTSVERQFGKLTPGVEYTWTRDSHLLGSRRLRDGPNWEDYIESVRFAQRKRLHAQLRYRAKADILMVSYDWVRSYDDTDGPFSFPADQSNLREERARSAGVSPHSVSLADSYQFPGGLFLTLMDTWRGNTPYNITSGLDVAGDGLYTDRGGRIRNSGIGPRFNSFQLYASRRITIPFVFLPKGGRLHVNLGVQGENLLGNKNYIGYGSVIGSPTFGQPLGTLPGRSVRVWINLD